MGERAALGLFRTLAPAGAFGSGAGRGDQLANIPLEPTPGGPLTRPAGFPRSVISLLARRGSAETLGGQYRIRKHESDDACGQSNSWR
jgi:hypothetical protein